MLQQKLDRGRKSESRGDGKLDPSEMSYAAPGAEGTDQREGKLGFGEVSEGGGLPPVPDNDDELDLSWGKAVMPDFSNEENATSLPTARMDHKDIYAAADAVDSTDAAVISSAKPEEGARRDRPEKKKRPVWIPLAILAVVLALAAGAWFITSNTDLFRGNPAARVNGETISVQELDLRFDAVAIQNPEMLDPTLGGLEAGAARRLILDSMIDDLLLMQEADAEGVTVSNDAVQEQIDARAATFPSEESFKEELTANGFTLEMFRDQTRYAMILEALLEHLVPADSMSDEQVREYFDANIDLYTEPAAKRTSHILLPLADESAAADLLEELQNSTNLEEDFADAAQEYSIDASSADYGGDADWPRVPDQRHPDYIAAADSLNIGELSELITTELGHFIILVTDERAEATLPFEDVAPGIRDMKLSTARNQKRVDLVERLRDEASIEILDPVITEEE
ncbi:MAG: SurA N-terminal domain-containing protein [Coriobacteriia bacterium]|nr:SurA N-terminal domain-containing protein [Coriobacteriia bacterium]